MIHAISLNYRHATQNRAYRVEIQQDLLGDWALTRYYSGRRKISVHEGPEGAHAELAVLVKSLTKRGYIKWIQATHSEKARSDAAPWSCSAAVDAFTANVDWVDMNACCEMNADAFAHANRQRFKDWLIKRYKLGVSEQAVDRFSRQVWRRYRDHARSGV